MLKRVAVGADARHETFQITPHAGVGIFLYDQRGTACCRCKVARPVVNPAVRPRVPVRGLGHELSPPVATRGRGVLQHGERWAAGSSSHDHGLVVPGLKGGDPAGMDGAPWPTRGYRPQVQIARRRRRRGRSRALFHEGGSIKRVCECSIAANGLVRRWCRSHLLWGGRMPSQTAPEKWSFVANRWPWSHRLFSSINLAQLGGRAGLVVPRGEQAVWA